MIRIDPKASEALASAIVSAKRGTQSETPALAKSARPEPEAAAPAAHRGGAPYLRRAAAAAAMIAACGLASYAGTQAHRTTLHQAGAEAAARNEDAFAKLSGELETLKTEIGSLRTAAGMSSRADTTGQARLNEKIEALAAILRNPDVRSSALEARLDRMESQIMTTLADLAAKPAAAAAPPPAITEAAVREPGPAPAPPSAPAVKPVRNEPVDGWILREVYDGAALVEGQNRRLYEVVPGGVVPGVGRVESIERRGRSWVVLTDKGFIGSYR